MWTFLCCYCNDASRGWEQMEVTCQTDVRDTTSAWNVEEVKDSRCKTPYLIFVHHFLFFLCCLFPLQFLISSSIESSFPSLFLSRLGSSSLALFSFTAIGAAMYKMEEKSRKCFCSFFFFFVFHVDAEDKKVKEKYDFFLK